MGSGMTGTEQPALHGPGVETTWVEGGTSGRSIGCAEACRAAAAAARRAWCVNSTFAASDSAACNSKTLDWST